jgi:hypothetical protein
MINKLKVIQNLLFSLYPLNFIMRIILLLVSLRKVQTCKFIFIIGQIFKTKAYLILLLVLLDKYTV